MYHSYNALITRKIRLDDKTRMHSSRTHTARSLTVSHSIPWGSAQPPGCRPPQDTDPLDADHPDADLHKHRPPSLQTTPWMQTTPWKQTPAGCRPPSGCKPPWSCDLWCMLGSQPPMWTEWQSGVKTLPSQTSFASGKNLSGNGGQPLEN